jgi:hypothetical protein
MVTAVAWRSQAAGQQEDAVMAGDQAPVPEPQQEGSFAPAAPESVGANASAEPSTASAASPDSEKKGKRESFAAPQAKPEDVSVLLPE